MSRKVFIMSASTGGGHNRAARAIQEELVLKKVNGENIECEIIDSLKLINTFMDKIISRGYEKSAIYTPEAYGSMYRLSETGILSKNEFKGNPLAHIMARKFKTLLSNEKPDLIIGTHPFPMIALSRMKKVAEIKKRNDSLKDYDNDEFESYFHWVDNSVTVPPMISILTDYTTHSTWIQNEIDYYVVGHEYVKELLIYEGVDADKVKPFGIPVEKSFLVHRDRETVLRELGLDPDKKVILLMGGSFGAGNMKETLEELLYVKRDFQILVVAGRNKSLKEKMEKRLAEADFDKTVRVLGFTDKMNDILASVDFIITKPGGLTTTECLLKGVPMIVPYYIPGQEEENLDFLTNCGAAIRTTKKYSLPVLLSVLLDSPEQVELIKNNIAHIKKTNSARNIANMVVDILEKNISEKDKTE
ncbi:glycosyl transferase [Peptacetobacter hominis]|uniref:Glycosyl transferase n=1 Tax=Peptacetobacter hominis TaxID=2743610 RepID=A0A544QSZ8_9FIRM|nr:glycosyltransferase [Peptacetobacter hominis]TQQ83163.1 glycosyl transferase [Peptacetobacter hominis]